MFFFVFLKRLLFPLGDMGGAIYNLVYNMKYLLIYQNKQTNKIIKIDIHFFILNLKIREMETGQCQY